MGKKANRKSGRPHWGESEIFEKFVEIFFKNSTILRFAKVWPKIFIKVGSTYILDVITPN